MEDPAMDPDSTFDELLELAFGEVADESAESDEEDFLSQALDALAGLTVADEPKGEIEAALDALASGIESADESSAASTATQTAQQEATPTPQPVPTPKPVLTIAEQKHELLVQLLALKRQYGCLERVPRDKLDDLREVVDRWSDDELDAWRKNMGTYVLLQAQAPAEKRDVSGVNQYFDALTVFIDHALGRAPRRVKTSSMARSSYIMLGALHMAHRAPHLVRNSEFNVVNIIKVWDACDRWLKQGNTLERPEAQRLMEHCRNYVTEFVRGMRTGWESIKARIATDDTRKLVTSDPVEVEMSSAQGEGAESHLAQGNKVLASALTRSSVDDQTVALLKRVLVAYYAYKRAKAESAEPETLSTTETHQQALGFLQMSKQKYEEAQLLEQSLIGTGTSLPRKLIEERQREDEEEGTHRRKRQQRKGKLPLKVVVARRKRAQTLFKEAQKLEAQAGEIFASLEQGQEFDPFLDALAGDTDTTAEEEGAEDDFDALLEQTLL